ncbi:MAG: hypothetical protein H0U23_04530 [Blastocatellia bacterium]|nr:hypothetical protein [Blastocatellia bacterium]
MKYELTVDAEYLDPRRWDAAAGIREFLQNGRDAAIEQNAPLEVTHVVRDDGVGVLRIENEGAVLTKDVLLLGRSTKRDRQDELAGFHGEGLKVGALALLRAGHEVKIRNGGEVWTPSIQASEKFDGRPVLVFDVTSGRAERNRVRVEISGVSQDDWKALREHFLFLYKREIELVKTEHGSLILSPKFKGRVYVKGILVQTIPALEYGYDLSDAELDRDRRMLDSYDLNNRTHRIWAAALQLKPALFAQYYTLLESRSRDAEGLTNWNAYLIPTDLQEQAGARFKTENGENAIPVENLATSKDLEHLGARGIVCSPGLSALLRASIGTPEDFQAKLATETTKIYSWSDLSTAEKANLERAISLLNNVGEKVSLDVVSVVDFRSSGLKGLYSAGSIKISKSELSNRGETLGTLVHEFAHKYGVDGDKSHVAAIERLWSAIVENLENSFPL